MADSTQPSELSPEEIRKAKVRERNRAYHIANREAILAKQRDYRKVNKQKMLLASREWNRKNRARVNATTKAWNEANKYRVKELNRIFHQKNKDAIRNRKRAWREANFDHVKRLKKAWCDANQELVRSSRNRRHSHRIKTDAAFNLMCRVRSRVSEVLARAMVRKQVRTIELVGCTGSELKEWIESQFIEGMSWENRSEWHIDHIIPLSKFDLADPAQQGAAFHYTNLQPLWAKDNLKKSDKVTGQIAFGFAYAAKIAGTMDKVPKKRRKHGG